AILCAAAGFAMLAMTGPVTAQPAGAGGPTPAQIAQAHTLFDQMDPACSAGSPRKACGVLVYAPEDCATAKKQEGHVRQVYATTSTSHMVRYQQNNTGVANQRPIMLFQPFGIIDRDGKTQRFVDPVFVSWDEYEKGKRDVEVCGQKTRLEVKDFELDS